MLLLRSRRLRHPVRFGGQCRPYKFLNRNAFTESALTEPRNKAVFEFQHEVQKAILPITQEAEGYQNPLQNEDQR